MDDQLEHVIQPLSPIVEMDESSILESIEGQEEDSLANLEDGIKIIGMLDGKLKLETTVENLEDRLSQPETPPEILRVRLNSLQNDFEELKEFTDLERQMYHADCIPKEKMRILEGEFTSLNEKVQHLMHENSEYKRKLKIEEDEKSTLKSELEKALNLQSERITVIGQMKRELGLLENMNNTSTMDENEVLPSSSFLKKCDENITEQFSNLLKDLDGLLKIILHERKGLQDKIIDLQSEVFELNGEMEKMNEKAMLYQHNLTLIKSNSVKFQESLDKELREVSVALENSEKKLKEVEFTKDLLKTENCKLQSKINGTQEKIISIINTLESSLYSLNENSDFKNSFVFDEVENYLAALLNKTYSRDIFCISNTFDILIKLFHKLGRNLKFKHEECDCLKLNIQQLNDQLREFEENALEQKLNIQQLNDQLRKFEENALEQKHEVEFLKEQIKERIPARLDELEHCLVNKDNENCRMNNELEAANAQIAELSNKLGKTAIKMNEMEVLLHKNILEKTSLENEFLKLKAHSTIDDVQPHIILITKYLEQLINSWNERANLGDLVYNIQGNKDIRDVTSLLLNDQTKTFFYEVAMKYKMKLLLHDEEKNRLCSSLENLKNDIDHMEKGNENLRLELSALDHIVREGISNRVNDLEKLLCPADETYMCNGNEEKNNPSLVSEENMQKGDVNLLGALSSGSEKLQKEINNLNKAKKSGDGVEKIMWDLNEIENLIDSLNCLEKFQIGEFTKCLKEKFSKYCDNQQNSELKVDVSRIFNKFDTKMKDLLQLNDELLQTVKMLSSYVEDYKNNQEIFNSTIKNLEYKCNALEGEKMPVSENEDQRKIFENNTMKEVETIKKLMMLEITSLDRTEDEDSLKCDSVENLFSKLMLIIMKKEEEMSYDIQKQQKEEFYNFEQTIEKLNNKLKSQESWTNALESENEKINSELCALKSLNSLFDNKVKAFSNDINNKTLEIDIMKNKILELTTENNSLISELNATNDVINKNKNSICSLKKDNEKLTEEVVRQSSIIRNLEMKLTSSSAKQEHSNSELNVSCSNSLMNRVNQIRDGEFNNVGLNVGPDLVKGQQGKPSETELSMTLRKELAFINNMLKKKENNTLSEVFSRCHDNLELLKEIIQTIGSNVLELELRHVNDIQSIKTILEHKTKEMHDLKLSVSKLYRDFVDSEAEIKKGNMIDESLNQYGMTSLMEEFGQIKSECISVSDRSKELEQSAKMGQNIIQGLRNEFQAVLNENHNMAKLIQDLRRCVRSEQKKTDKQRQKVYCITKEKNELVTKTSLLENEISNLKSELSLISKEIFSEIDLSFPDKMQTNEKVAYINNTLKQFLDVQKLFSIITEDLRFFGYQCELMLSYNQSLEFKLCSATQQKEQLEKENSALKSQLFNQNLEMNRFINQLISKSPLPINSINEALVVIAQIFSEYKFLKESKIKHLKEDKCKQEKIVQKQKELTSLTKHNLSLKFELNRCEDSIRNLRSELRSVRSQFQKRGSIGLDSDQLKQEKTDIGVQTEGTCCKRLQRKITEQKEKIDGLSAKLTKYEQLQRSSLTSNPYNKQVTYLEGALDQAKERIGRLHLALKQQESCNQELIEALKRHENCRHRPDEEN